MDTFLEIYNLPRWNHEEIGRMNRSVISMKIESANKNLQQRKAKGQVTSLVNATKHLKETYYKSFSSFSKKLRRKKMDPNPFYEVNIILIPEPDKENYRPTYLMNRQILKCNDTLKGLFTRSKWDLSLECKNGLTYKNQLMWYTTFINKG